MTTPGNGSLSFERDIRPLFRERDRESMMFAFDLWSYDDVSEHAEDIIDRVEDGSMPCDSPWPADQLDLFRRWVDAGTPA